MGFDTNEIELWHVQMPGGAVRTMSLDDLDTAFNDDLINENTMVVKAGDQKWSTLGDLLGLNAPPPSYVVVPPAGPVSYAPSYAGSHAHSPSYPPPSYAASPSYPPPSYAPSAPSYAPSATPSYAPNSYAPPSYATSYDSVGQMQYSQPNSIAPFATDIASSNLSIPRLSAPPSFDNADFDMSPGTDELATFRPKRRMGRAFAIVATVAVMGFALFSVKSYGVSGIKAKVASATSYVKGHTGESARSSAGAPPAVMPLPSPANNAPPMANAPPAPIDPSPVTPTPASASDKNAKKGAKASDKKGAKPAAGPAKKAAPKNNDPTQRGATGQFDPLNGNI